MGERTRDLITQEAADWFVANRSNLASAQAEQFRQWLAASPIHVEEYLGVSAIARDLKAACAGIPVEDEADGAERDGRTWAERLGLAGLHRWPLAAAGAAAIALVAVGLYRVWPAPAVQAAAPAAWTASFATQHGQQRDIRLPDDSTLHLNTDTRVSVRYDNAGRQVVLFTGEAEFEVSHEPGRAFRVVAGPATVLDIGTSFNVRRDAGSVVVTVVEGKVQVSPTALPGGTGAGAGAAIALGAGQELTATEGSWPPVVRVADPEHSTAWLHRQISFEHEPLAKVAGEFNRYSPKPITIVTPALRTLEISGVFATDDTAAFIAFLRSLDGVHVEETATQVRVSQDKAHIR
ncbi:MAG TPA: FecR domain-containing protein [Steroidobacteraceae bacterium]|nr:FecR domain-containing protein [Steroidobacteraceae bacterium]